MPITRWQRLAGIRAALATAIIGAEHAEGNASRLASDLLHQRAARLARIFNRFSRWHVPHWTDNYREPT